ncbi:NmrA family NAD(P)-binding protein [Kineococcus sp. R8]|uniref:NmrA family NAD(P)-binding protein n=1 Tax=Kineococcus siccus TaxID=2696567 RepID=UPI001411BA8A|nr:NmrA family NAD(P)-binding protein [Kineococcus siccus]NAZ83506.1 NmrA family NAD(P)-binding protein [Kineococcus siccus]
MSAAAATRSVLVTGAAGDQGQATTRALRAAGFPVRAVDALDPDHPRAGALTATGATYRRVDLADAAAVRAVVDGVDVVFAVPVGDPRDEYDKLRLGEVLLAAAEEAGVGQVVQTSVAGLEDHLDLGDLETGHTSDAYAVARLRLEARVRRTSIPRWTVLRPVFLMENFLPHKAAFMYPGMGEHRLDSAQRSDTRFQMVSVVDIATFAVAAVRRPDDFHRRVVEFAAGSFTMGEVAETLSAATGTRFTHRALTVPEALQAGVLAGVVHSQEWLNRVGYHADEPERLTADFGVELTRFAQWADQHAHLIGAAA